MITLYSDVAEAIEQYRLKLPFAASATEVANLAIRKGMRYLPLTRSTNNKPKER